jgi:hypothetical protein
MINFNFTIMKKLQQNLKKWPIIIGITCLLAGLLSSCTKSTNNQPITSVSLLSVVDASPNAGAADFYYGGFLVNAAPFTYGNFLSYFNANPGSVKAVFYTSGTTTPIASDTVNLKANQAYTLFFANVVTHPDFILTLDTISAPSGSTASIRLVDVSPNSPNVDLVIKGGATLVSNKSYKQVSSFVAVPTATQDTLQIRQTGTTTVLASIPGVNIISGYVYTVWLAGLSGTTTANIMTNAVYNY